MNLCLTKTIADKVSITISNTKISANEKYKYFLEYGNPLYGNKVIAAPNINPNTGIPIKIVLIVELTISSCVALWPLRCWAAPPGANGTNIKFNIIAIII